MSLLVLLTAVFFFVLVCVFFLYLQCANLALVIVGKTRLSQISPVIFSAFLKNCFPSGGSCKIVFSLPCEGEVLVQQHHLLCCLMLLHNFAFDAGPQLEKKIRALASLRDYTYVATGHHIVVFKRAHQVCLNFSLLKPYCVVSSLVPQSYVGFRF